MALDSLTPDAGALVGWLSDLRRRARRMHGLRGVGAGAAGGAVLAGLGEPGAGLGAVLLGAAIGAWRTPDCAALARRADDLGGLGDAVACAWDHRQRTAPIDAVQARVALRQARALDREALVPRPSVIWGLGLLLWVWPALQPAGLHDPRRGGTGGADATGEFPAEAELARAAAPPSAPGEARGPVPAEDTLRTGRASPSAPEEPEVSGEGKGEGDGHPPDEGGVAAGVGAKATEISAGKVRTAAAPEAPGSAGRTLIARRGVGGLGVTGEAAAEVGRAPSTRDDVLTDPARPFPAADSPLISAYFDRRAQRRPTAPDRQP